jgi:hypothetical protein
VIPVKAKCRIYKEVYSLIANEAKSKKRTVEEIATGHFIRGARSILFSTGMISAMCIETSRILWEEYKKKPNKLLKRIITGLKYVADMDNVVDALDPMGLLVRTSSEDDIAVMVDISEELYNELVSMNDSGFDTENYFGIMIEADFTQTRIKKQVFTEMECIVLQFEMMKRKYGYTPLTNSICSCFEDRYIPAMKMFNFGQMEEACTLMSKAPLNMNNAVFHYVHYDSIALFEKTVKSQSKHSNNHFGEEIHLMKRIFDLLKEDS